MSKKKKGLAKAKAQQKRAERASKINERLKMIEAIKIDEVSPDLIKFNDRQISYFYKRNRRVKKNV